VLPLLRYLAAASPVTKILDAFPGRAVEIAQFLLRQLEFAAHVCAAFANVISRQPEQLLRQLGEKVRECPILNPARVSSRMRPASRARSLTAIDGEVTSRSKQPDPRQAVDQRVGQGSRLVSVKQFIDKPGRGL
jgi:hypothetical protein